MNHRDIAAVSSHLEEAQKRLPGEPADCDELYEQFEYLAIQILDSEHDQFPPGQLEAYLHGYLAGWRCGLQFGTPANLLR